MGIAGPTNKALDAAWRDLGKDLMIAMKVVPGPTAVNYPKADFNPMAEGMPVRRLRPACHQLATGSVANNQARIKDIEMAVVHIVMDYATKLVNRVKTDGGQLGENRVPFSEVIVPGILLSTNIPAQWGVAMAVLKVACYGVVIF